MTKRIGVLVVDDSAFMRRALTDIMESTGDIKVLGTAQDGVEALEKVKETNPDVVTLDIEMPKMDGLTCLKEMQKITNAPVIMLSSLKGRDRKATIEALEAGGIDFIAKPASIFDISGDEKKKEIIEKVRMAYSISGNIKGGLTEAVGPAEHEKRESRKEGVLKTLIAIGASTGGPRALQEVLSGIHPDVPAAVVIVQHMPAGFTKSLAERLNSISRLIVKEAEDGEMIKQGYVYIAPGDYHMEIRKAAGDTLRIELTKEDTVNGHRPSVNVMMNSIAKTGFSSVIGVIMTGMGADGSEGIVNMKNSNNGIIITQDEQSCVVYGMPKAAVKTGVVDEVVPLEKIAGVIVKYLGVDH